VQANAGADAIVEAVMLGTRALVGVAARSLAEVSEDVSLAQYRVLVLIDGHGSQTMGELAESLAVNPSTVTRMCDVLVNKKFIRRGPARDNRRTVSAELTARGQKVVDQVMVRRRRLIAEAVDRMEPDAQRRLARSLAEFAEAAGELSDHAWTLGWSIDDVKGEDR
jgi:DNA-binding MarR family transcriptional regulator